MITKVLLVLVAGLVSACTHVILPPTPPESPVSVPEEAWARVLRRVVDGQGRVDFALLARGHADLDTYLAYIAQVSPHTHPGLVFLVARRR